MSTSRRSMKARCSRSWSDFCKANPDKKPVAAIDEFIRAAPKVKTKWEPGTIDWDGGEK